MTEKIVFGGGCFWCMEAVFQRIPGIIHVESGYAGGQKPNPTYREVCSGTTGHAEVVRVTYEADQIKLADVLDWFFRAHDPTTLNRQGADTGTQYRSIILFANASQKDEAGAAIKRAQARFKDPIVTEIAPLTDFFAAEKYHQNYYNNNREAGYCQYVIAPKLKKLGL